MNKLKTLLDLAALLDDAPKESSSPAITGQHIAVLDRGFVYVGDVRIDGDFLYLTNAQNIRVWGTKQGLGELRNGKLPDTRLDPVGEIIAPLKSLIHLVPCKGF